jgi:hypothetical protein
LSSFFLPQAELAADACGEPFAVRPLSAPTLRAALRAGLPVVVAFDRDPNTHLPCLRGGACAHWGAVRGAAWEGERADDDADDDDANGECNGSLLVLVGHTMSARALVCSFSELAASNAQLLQAKEGNGRWQVPKDGPDLQGLLVPLAPVAMK